MNVRHFLTLNDLSRDELHKLIQRAIELKTQQKAGTIFEPLKNKVLGMVFEKSSTRTRVSFETGMVQFGGQAIFLSPRDTQLGRGEPIEDSARVLSRMVDIIMIRTFEHEKIQRFAEYSRVPVINALTNEYVVWIGDGNNMCHSYINAAKQFGFQLQIASPEGYLPDAQILAASEGYAALSASPHAAVQDADLIVTDVWASMGQEEEQVAREQAFADYQVNPELMALAKPDALFMHCLPAHRGEEVATAVIDGTQSVVWDEAENRLHSQKALLEFLIG